MLPHDKQEHRFTPTGHEREPFLPLTLLTLAAPLLWVLHFAIGYLLEGFLCALSRSAAAIFAALFLVTLICGGACAYLLVAGDVWLRRAGAMHLQSYKFLSATQRALAGLSLVAILWASAGALFIDACAFDH